MQSSLPTDPEEPVNCRGHHLIPQSGGSMPKYVIEREIPGAGKLTPDQLKAISQTSCNVLRKLGPEIQWVHSYVTGEKIYCVYIAPNEQLVREHASQGGFPANRISEVSTIIDPTTSED
jgi:Nickel responsive protein SCO4226-like